jgi:uncharacterized protein (TIGR00725 family)
MNIGVFGSSLPREGEPAYEEAREIGRLIARKQGRVVCGGYGGVMEAVCRGAAEAGGSSLGVILEGGLEANRWVTRVSAEPDLSARLRRLRDASDAWVFLARGLGTMLELVWVSESVVKGDTSPRPFVLVGDYWRSIVEKAIAEASRLAGAEALRASLAVCSTPAEAVEAAFARESLARK